MVQFQISTPKTGIENSIIIKDYRAMDRVMRKYRKIITVWSKKSLPQGLMFSWFKKVSLKMLPMTFLFIFWPKKELRLSRILKGARMILRLSRHCLWGIFILDSLVLEVFCEITIILQIVGKPQKSCAHYLNISFIKLRFSLIIRCC